LANVMTGRQQAWHVTGGKRKRSSPFDFMIAQVLTFAFLFLTSIVAIYKDYSNGVLTIATAWNVTNTVILAVFIHAGFAELRTARRGRRAARRLARRPVIHPQFGPAATPVPNGVLNERSFTP
jgi:cellulose synthase (UDP-forming)